MLGKSNSRYFGKRVSSFVVDGTCGLIMLAVAIVLALPLIYRIRYYLGEATKSNCAEENTAKKKIFGSSSVKMQSPLPSTEMKKKSVANLEDPTRKESNSSQRKSKSTDASSSEIANVSPTSTHDQPSIVGVNYGVYRHRMIEATLKRHYNGNYAPGNVVMNFLHLNACDSKAEELLGEKYEAEFFDHVKKSIDEEKSKIESVDPLDHFIPKTPKTAETSDQQTETEVAACKSELETMVESVLSRPLTPTRPATPKTQKPRRPRLGNKYTRCLVKSPIVVNNSLSPVGSSVSLDERPRCTVFTSVIDTESKIIDSIEIPKTEQLYRRNDARPSIDSKTHVDTQKYLNVIGNDHIRSESFA